MTKHEHELILCIINRGFSEAAMDAAREGGARGGTVIRARGTAAKEAERAFHITIQPEKEVLMIIAPVADRDAILHELYRAVGQNTPAHGIAFSLPVDETVGLGGAPAVAAKKAEEKKEEKKSAKEAAEQPAEQPEEKPKEAIPAGN